MEQEALAINDRNIKGRVRHEILEHSKPTSGKYRQYLAIKNIEGILLRAKNQEPNTFPGTQS